MSQASHVGTGLLKTAELLRGTERAARESKLMGFFTGESSSLPVFSEGILI